jgi:hypothetical protein
LLRQVANQVTCCVCSAPIPNASSRADPAHVRRITPNSIRSPSINAEALARWVPVRASKCLREHPQRTVPDVRSEPRAVQAVGDGVKVFLVEGPQICALWAVHPTTACRHASTGRTCALTRARYSSAARASTGSSSSRRSSDRVRHRSPSRLSDWAIAVRWSLLLQRGVCLLRLSGPSRARARARDTPLRARNSAVDSRLMRLEDLTDQGRLILTASVDADVATLTRRSGAADTNMPICPISSILR